MKTTERLFALFVASLSACAPGTSGAAVTGPDDGGAFHTTELAFSEARCTTATPDRFETGHLPDTTIGIPIAPGGSHAITIPGFGVSAPYANPRCYRTYVVQLDHADSSIHQITASTGTCDRSLGLQVYASAAYRIAGGGVRRTDFTEVGLVTADTDATCNATATIAVPNSTVTGPFFDYSYRIFATARTPDNTVDSFWLSDD
jgi:hypothetical protein